MKVKDLKNMIENVPDELEVYMRCVVNPTGNIIEVKEANQDHYGFFGESIPCIIIEPETGE